MFRDERIHERVAERGSLVSTYCAITQSRNNEDKVEERLFYWVVRVRPQQGFLSDYERGSWESPPPGEVGDYPKLCMEEARISDSELLRSKKHRSSGSTFDPTAESVPNVSRDWLIGSWVMSDSCATSRDILFRSDGFYEAVDERGTWALAGKAAQLKITEAAEGEDSDGEATFRWLPTPRIRQVPIDRLGIDRLRMNGKFELRRC
jgi:hypothetical protein